MSLKVMTIVGTRPEIIKLSRVMYELEKHARHVLVHTGQNYDYELNEIFFKELKIRKPDYFLNSVGNTLAQTIGNIIAKSDEVMEKEKPDAVLLYGDTNSCLSVISAKRRKIPIFHMEAGNRCFDFNVPEEINRRIIDHIADFNLVYTEHARRHLISEGLPQRRIYLTGSPMCEVLNFYKPKIDGSGILNTLKLEKGRYFVVSVHREENVDNPGNLEKILLILNRLAGDYEVPVIVSTHPRTRKRLEAVDNMKMDPQIQFLKPFGFTDYVHLQMNALCTVSDSGTISEESAILNFPAISLRNSMERPEAQDAGTIILTGFQPDIVLQSIDLVISDLNDQRIHQAPPDYEIPDTSIRVLKLIIGLSSLSNRWHGIPV